MPALEVQSRLLFCVRADKTPAGTPEYLAVSTEELISKCQHHQHRGKGSEEGRTQGTDDRVRKLLEELSSSGVTHSNAAPQRKYCQGFLHLLKRIE